MKVTKQIFLFVLIALSIFSCSDDDNVATNENIIENATLPSDLPPLYQSFYEENGGLNYALVNDSKMAYTDNKVSNKPIIVLVHGLPDNNFLYRNVIKELGNNFRVIAPDHIGYGLSDRPDLEYSFTTISNYFEGFIKALNLDEVNLVLTDVGGPAGFGFAARNPELIKSITMYETLWLPVDDLENSNYAPPFQEFLLNIRTPNVGEDIVIEQNQMLGFLDQLTVTSMPQNVQDVYAYPWKEKSSRNVLLENSRSIPVGGAPVDSKALFDNFVSYLKNSSTPKLIIQVNPGAISPPSYVDQALNLFPQSRKIVIEDAGHFLTEDKPVEFANTISEFISEVN